jgi:hypothetical protein
MLNATVMTENVIPDGSAIRFFMMFWLLEDPESRGVWA